MVIGIWTASASGDACGFRFFAADVWMNGKRVNGRQGDVSCNRTRDVFTRTLRLRRRTNVEPV